MNTYGFILGRNQALSIAELSNIIDRQIKLGNKIEIKTITTDAIILTFEKKLQRPQESLNLLGGTIKIVEIFKENISDLALTPAIISDYLVKNHASLNKKLPYGLSIFSFTQKHEEILKRLLKNIKNNLKENKINSRFINKNFSNLKTSAIIGEKLIEKGAEIVLINDNKKIFIGKTIAIQDIDWYSKRDFNRPCRDARLGMLPPKLAQIMINLGGKTDFNLSNIKHTILDPFAGIGTILTEGILMGYDIIGSDISQEIIEKSQKNIDWIIQEKKIEKPQIHLFTKDATTIKKSDIPTKIDLIITESYLGPPQSKVPTQEEINKIFKNIENTIKKFLIAINPIINKETKVIISFPAYKDKNRYHHTKNSLNIIKETGFKIKPLINKEIIQKATTKKVFLPISERQSLIYDRPDQTVAREIFKLIKDKEIIKNN